MENNEIVMKLHEGEISRTWGLFQYDYGQRLIFEGVELPVSYEVHFSNQEVGKSKTQIGDSSGVDIPDEFLLSGESIHVWVFLHSGESDGETVYHGIIGVSQRAKPTYNQPTPVQQDVITQAIAALTSAVETTGQDVTEANAAKDASQEALRQTLIAKGETVSAKESALEAARLAGVAKDDAVTSKNEAVEAKEGAVAAKETAEEIAHALPETIAQALQEAKDSGEFDGEDGATFTPSIVNGVISWTNDKQLPNPDPVDLAEELELNTLAKKTELPTKVSDLQNDAGYLSSTEKGSANGVAELDENGKVVSEQLPSYVDDVVEYPSVSQFPVTGESGKIYVALDTNVTYRWSGSAYVKIGSDLALGETASTAYRGDRGKAAYDHATDSGKIASAQSVGLYKIAVTSEGHIASVSAVQRSDLEALLPVASTAETQAIITDWGVSA